MLSRIVHGLTALALACGAGPVMAQDASATVGESTNRVALHRDWSVFEETGPTKQCWIVSPPKETVNTRDGRVVAVRRGDILLHISFIPEKDVDGQVSFMSGYPFREGSVVTVDIDGQSFNLFTLGELAWTNSDEDDTRILAALKRGKEAVIVGMSSRGTKTTDTFSLLGVTAAAEDARNRCRG